MKSHRYKVEVRFSDIDVMGHVNNAVYLSYFEQSRVAYFHALLGGSWDWNSHGVILARNEVDYLRPVLLHDEVWIETYCCHMGTKSLQMAYKMTVRKGEEETPCCTGKSVLVCYDHTTRSTTEVPEDWKKNIEVVIPAQ